MNKVPRWVFRYVGNKMVSRLENLILGQVRIGERQATYGALVELKTDLGLVQRIFERSD